VSRSTDLVGQITVASEEQAIGIEQINRSLVHIDGVTGQNADLVEPVNTTILAMRDQSTLLSEQMAYFRADAGTARYPISPEGVLAGAYSESSHRAHADQPSQSTFSPASRAASNSPSNGTARVASATLSSSSSSMFVCPSSAPPMTPAPEAPA